uniref:Major facilitator superfamily (MFS) profile domain-containing protein n=1 Tax=Alexandrium catenella TaxID=2925 RepID=A0A7S1PUF9_ALECA|eukprot:CAMPEP_0171227528 /NCGR_PEP_ID=MMETSP0790-20130122/37891_1 /TAXON_ID=2925 /ORGANISM="Alexandrium catenella, Strain OF101" /LENGTH=418 /DNA_ID=CAMNT_0011693639 /DNA_START=48 /DNA_END=1304 /DNA_ORIENTATION=-
MAGRIAVAHRVGFLAFPMIFAGPLLDIWGRKPVLQLAVAGCLAELSCYLGAAYTYSDRGLGSELHWLLPAGFFTGMTDALDPAATSMVADLSAPTADGRSAALSLFMVTRHISHMLGILGSSQIMRLHLGDYNLVWVSGLIFTTGLLFTASFLLRETLAEDESNSNGCGGAVILAVSHRPTCGSCPPVCRPICTKFAEAFRFIWLDRFLLHFLLLRFTLAAGGAITHAVVEPFLVGHLGYPMHIAALGAGIFPCTMALGSGLYWVFAPRCGPFAMYGGGILMVGLGFGLCGLAGPCSRFADAAFWGGLVFAAFGNGMIDPTTYVITSLRADPCTVGVVFTLLHALGTFGSIVGQLLTTQILFDAQAQGWAASLPLFISSATMFLSLAWFVWAYTRSHPTLVFAEDNCDSSDSEESTFE